jgi:hypothetical protein
MREPKFKMNDVVHVNGTSGIGRILFVEYTGLKYIYVVSYPDGKRKKAEESDLINID